MPFTFSIRRGAGQQPLAFNVIVVQALFVVGANGSGKSGLIHNFYLAHQATARRISAHRQTWFSSGGINLSPQQKRQTEENIRSWDQSANARWTEHGADVRPSVALFDLMDAENVRAREITAAVDQRDMTLAETLAQKDAPLKVINELLRLANIPIAVSARKNEEIVASKNGGASFGIEQLSDGERNALLIAANVLTAPPGILFLIDEPERHLHRSIISPLLTQLFAKRSDCSFVVSTHDVMLPMDNPTALILLVRNCTYQRDAIVGRDVDLLEGQAEISDDLKKDILGARRKVLFIEGEEHSLDKSLFAIVFPGVSIIPKSSCRDVEHAVTGIRGAKSFHWVNAFGIIDNDGRTLDDVERLKRSGVYALCVYSVESVYYHTEVQRRVASRFAAAIGGDAAARLSAATTDALAAIQPHAQRLSQRAVEKSIRERIIRRLPGQPEIAAQNPINISVDVAEASAQQRAHLDTALAAGNLVEVITKYPVRETPALDVIAGRLGFRDRSQYEDAVRTLLMNDNDALTFVRSLFGSLWTDISVE